VVLQHLELFQNLQKKCVVGKAIMNRYEKAPSVDKAQLLDVDLREAGSNSRDYIVELIVDARGKQRHLLSKLILTDRKVVNEVF
jgi:hypothetical protein